MHVRIIVTIASLCSTNATWSKTGITVAGFANGSSGFSLNALFDPNYLSVDAIGNMFIFEPLSCRVMYWPVNSNEGRIVVGTGICGEAPNQLPITPSMFACKD